MAAIRSTMINMITPTWRANLRVFFSSECIRWIMRPMIEGECTKDTRIYTGSGSQCEIILYILCDVVSTVYAI
jgi:hypothetical protein